MASPKDCRYTTTHEWCRADGDVAVVGLTQHAVDQLTDLVYVDLPALGTTVAAGGPFGEIESVKAVSELNAPVSGEILESNQAVTADPSGISADPYGEGWLVRVRMSDRGELDGLMDAAAYDASLAD
jgi:glycine cleavage system H protein